MSLAYPIKALGELCDVLDSKRRPITKRDRIEGEFPYYGATGILGYVEGYIFDEPLVLIGEDGAKWGAGENTAFSAEGRYWVNNHAHVIRPHREKLLDAWLIYQLNQVDLSPFITGLTVPKLNQAKMREIPIILPPLDEQRRIVAVLDKAFAGIATATAHAQKNLTNARALFESFQRFVFDPANVEGAMKPISAFASVFDGPHATPKTVDHGPIFLGISSLQNGEIILSKTRHVTPADYVKWTKRVAPTEGDVVFSYETRLGQVGLIPQGMECCLGRRMGLVRLDQKQVDPQFFVYSYLAPAFQELLKEQTIKGATVDRIALKDFPSYQMQIPTIDIQKSIVETISNMKQKVTHLGNRYQKKLTALSELKQSLLQKAFAGELT